MIRTGFSALDNLTGGLSERQGYLVYGNAQEAKSALALAFLASGVANGESVALVTDRPVEAVLEEGRGYGFDLSDAILSGKLQCFEYPEAVAMHSMQLLDDSCIMDEFQKLAGPNGIQRLVFDPVTPLLNTPNPGASAKRFHAIISSVSRMGATAIYLIDASGIGDNAPSVREMAHGVMRLDAEGLSSGKIVFERWPEGHSAESLDFGIVAGIGLVSLNRLPSGSAAAHGQDKRGSDLHFSPFQIPSTRASSVGSLAPSLGAPAPRELPPGFSPNLLASPAPAPSMPVVADREQQQPGILVIHPDSALRAVLVASLSPDYRVSEAHGVASGMAMLSGDLPDILVMSNEMAGACGGALAFKLRQSSYNMPVIVVGSRGRRTADKAKFLRAGVDVVFDYPVDVPLLHLTVDNLLRRVGRLDGPLHPESEPPQFQKRAIASCTTDLDSFCERVAEGYARPEMADSPPMFTLRLPSASPMVEELSSTVLLTVRATDLAYVGTRGVAVFLADSTERLAFLSRFNLAWTGAVTPRVDDLRISGQGNLRVQLRQFVCDSIGQSFPQSGGNGLNNRSFEAVAAGHQSDRSE
jgi:KaiC/GvpD/RAD55 family RecA-like ATPase/CheY-like chemotaxis protein